jgi:putative oxidoreductase
MIPERFSPYLLSAMRAVFGFAWIFHGLDKFGVFGGDVVVLASLRGAGGVIEVLAGALIMLGWQTRTAAFLASGQMAVAYFMVHAPRGPWPIQNGGELAVLYCFAFLYIAAKGPGPLAIDRR